MTRSPWPAGLLFLFACASRNGGPAPDGVRPSPSARTTTGSLVKNEPGTPRAQALALLCRTLADRDDDCDGRITVEDDRAGCSPAGQCPDRSERWPYVARVPGLEVRVDRLHEAAQLVQELVLALRARPEEPVRLDLGRVRMDPATYLGHRIKEHFWDALTRRIDTDPDALARAATDQKLHDAGAAPADLCEQELPRCHRMTRESPVNQPPAAAPELFVYYPATDARARTAFANAGAPGRLTPLPLPERPTPDWVLATTRSHRHGLLTLALDENGRGRPFVVPGGRFNEMYGWDSFFIVWGLVQDRRRVELARSIVDNQAYEVIHYGKILNANRTYYLTRSQPPFFTSSVREVWDHLPHDESNRRWLAGVLSAAIEEYRGVWSSPPRRLALCDDGTCLARYFGEGTGEPPEVEPGHFDWYYQSHAVSHRHCERPTGAPASRQNFIECASRMADDYRAGRLRDPSMDSFFTNDRSMRESGHDTTFRWFVDGEDHCADFATVDLNALLFKYEVDLATLIEKEFEGSLAGGTASEFCRRARARARLIRRYLWDERSGAFFDYDTKRGRRSKYLSATTLYPLWASMPNVCDVSLATPVMASSLVPKALHELEAAGGLRATAPSSLARVEAPSVLRRATGGFEAKRSARQWETPNGWAPHQMLAWVGLSRHGFTEDAERLAYRWLYTIVENAAEFHGTVPEKFDVEKRSHAVFAEYGNVNTEFAYIAEEGFGWMNASFVVGVGLLDSELYESLKRLVPPERLAGRLRRAP